MPLNSKIREKKRVLIIDDDHDVALMLKLLLETREYLVDVVNCGKDGMQKAASGYDLILLDLILPDYDGFQVCHKLKEDKATRHIPIIILSAKHLFEDKVEGLYLGADDFLTKPFEHEELFARMEAVMRRGQVIQPQYTASDGTTLLVQLRKIIDKELVVPYFQPIYYLKPRKLLGLEVLTRPNVEGPLANPELLFKTALKYGLYHEIEMLAWEKALQFVTNYLSDQLLFFNCNPYLIEGPRFMMIKSMFDQNSVAAKNVILEITERSRIVDYKVFYENLKKYRDYGFRFAVDDVGGGFASLESIAETRPEVVKIDRHIVKDLQTDPFKRSIVKFVVSFCKENDIISIAEGIETKEQLDTLIELGADAGQGYYLYKPTPTIDLEDICKKVA